MLACASALLLTAAVHAQQAKPAAASAQPAPSAPMKFLPPIRGTAEIGMTKPATKRVGKNVVTTFKVKNLSDKNSVVGLKVEEFWYDKKGNPANGGDTFRYRKPLLPGEVIDVSLDTPVDPSMASSQYKLSHANGTVSPKPMDDKGNLITQKAAAPAAKPASKKKK
jgi:hypothetical protein